MEETPQIMLGKLFQMLESTGMEQDKVLSNELEIRIKNFSRRYKIALRNHHEKNCKLTTKMDVQGTPCP